MIRNKRFVVNTIRNYFMFVFRLKQKKIHDYPIDQLNSIGLSSKFVSWYLKEWTKRNFKEIDKNAKEKPTPKVKI